MTRLPPRPTLFPYTTLFRSIAERRDGQAGENLLVDGALNDCEEILSRSEEHTSESSHITISYAVFCLKKKITLEIPESEPIETIPLIPRHLHLKSNPSSSNP